MTEVLTRFAPSPTGKLHVGNARVALTNWLFARKAGGRMMLRLDDTDTDRSTAEYAAGIETDLRWLGLLWDSFARQSDRMDRYAQAVERLKADGRLYPCFETTEELDLKRKIALSAGRPPIYDRSALKLSEADRARLLAEGLTPHWRFKLLPGEIAWTDLVRGPVSFSGENLSDPVLLRADGRPLYTLSSTVDDVEFGVTHVLRGEDHVSNTAVQVQIFEALGGPVPVFGHFTLLTDASGAGLSKRLGSLSLESLQAEGLEAMAVNSYLAGIGTSQAIEAATDLATLIDRFDITAFGRAAPKFDAEDLKHLNPRILQGLPFDAVASRLAERGLAEVDEAFWLAVRGNITMLSDVGEWWRICRTPLAPAIADEDRAFLFDAANRLPAGDLTEAAWSGFVESVKAETGRKGKALFMPFRKALTGQDHGPEIPRLVPLMGRARIVARLRGETA